MNEIKAQAVSLVDKSFSLANEKLAQHDQAVIVLGSIIAARTLYNIHDFVTKYIHWLKEEKLINDSCLF